ncbi:MAG: 2-C-methyl-D-erythritol 4-phosphate cytidylyltransferase [Erysipelotrichia bacterium]|nr:2-C-methyl-D-erythritol 4-phosphate cytidylyltransferase [Erysipelotrichia bacterium]
MNIAVILAAGKSERLNEITVPKQLYLINKVPLFLYSVLTFNELPEIDEIYLVTNDESLPAIEKYLKQSKINKVKGIIIGGVTRQESVYLAIKHLQGHAKNDDIILIHDAARPLIEKDTILANIEGVKKFEAATTAIKVHDTVFNTSNGHVDHIVDRSLLYQAQTPQSFKYRLIKKAHEMAIINSVYANDNSTLAIQLGYDIHLINGTTTNFKVTTFEDVKLLEMIILKK